MNHRGNWLKQEELWAVCRECALTLQSISHSTEIVQGLCVMLETLAFDSGGHVCFTDHEIGENDRYFNLCFCFDVLRVNVIGITKSAHRT